MKTAVPVLGPDSQAKICAHFGSAPYFAIFNAKEGDIEFWSRDEQIGGHQCAPVDEFLQRGVKQIVSGGMGRGALNRLQQSGIQVSFVSDADLSLAEIIAGLGNKSLSLDSETGICAGHGHGEHHHHGHEHGQSCH